MSVSVKTKTTQWKDMELLKAAFRSLGWSWAKNTCARTYYNNPLKEKQYENVAVSPLIKGYDVGLINETSGTITPEADLWEYNESEGMIPTLLGKDYGRITQRYNVELIRQYGHLNNRMVDVRTLANGNLHVELT